MMRLVIYLIFTLALILPLWGQYDERQILVQQANQMMVQRQYSQAEELFLQVLAKFPDDITSILQLANLYLNISAGEKAEDLLLKYQRQIPEKTFSEFRIQVLLLQGKLDHANDAADAYLNLYGGMQNSYNLLASYFSRRNAHENAIRIFNKGREQFGSGAFSIEIANSAMQIQRYELAMREYMRFMADQSNMNLFVKNQVISIVAEENSLINIIREAVQPGNQIMLELLASALLALKRNDEALEIYRQLPLTYLRDFAAEQLKQENFEIARRAYSILATNSPQAHQRLGFSLEIARIFHRNAEFDSAASVVDTLLQDPYWSQSPQNRRNPLYVAIRKLKAENDMARGVELAQIRDWIRETRQFSSQVQESQELDLEIARLSILNRDFITAERALSSVSIPKLLNVRDYLGFLQALLKGDSTLADSLMNEYIIKHPGSEYANDIMYLNMLGLGMNDTQRQSFGEAIRLLQLFRIDGVDMLSTLYEQTEDEELLILAIEWALGLGDNTRAETMLKSEFKDELAKEYAKMLGLALVQDRQEQLDIAREFLKVRPNSIFSPRFRQVISRIAAAPPSL